MKQNIFNMMGAVSCADVFFCGDTICKHETHRVCVCVYGEVHAAMARSLSPWPIPFSESQVGVTEGAPSARPEDVVRILHSDLIYQLGGVWKEGGRVFDGRALDG
jgi:hypothetical protein